MNMPIPYNSLQIQIFNQMLQFYKCIINNFAMIMALITKLTRKHKVLCGHMSVRKLGSS
jgi:hypothetical protein